MTRVGEDMEKLELLSKVESSRNICKPKFIAALFKIAKG